MQLTGLLPVVRRWWLALLAATVLAGCIGLVTATLLTPTYEAEVRLLVGPLNTDVNTLRASGQLARTYAELATGEPLIDAATSALDPEIVSPEEVEVTATADEVTRILSIRVRASDHGSVAPIANGLAEQLQDRVDTGIVRPEGELQVVDAARPPDGPVAPRVPLTGVLSAVAGLLIATTLVLVYEYLTPMVRTGEQLERLRSDIPLIGVLPRRTERNRSKRGPAADAFGGGTTVSIYALASARLASAAPPGRPAVLAVLGAGPTGHASHVAVNLAAMFIAQGQRPVMVEADRASAVSRLLSIDNTRSGLTDDLGRGSGGVELVRAPVFGAVSLDVLPYGSADATLVVRDRAASLLASLAEHGAPVLVETAPIARDPDALVWTALADAALLVVQRNRDRLDEVDAAISALLATGVTIVGMVLDDSTLRPSERATRQAAASGRAAAKK